MISDAVVLFLRPNESASCRDSLASYEKSSCMLESIYMSIALRNSAPLSVSQLLCMSKEAKLVVHRQHFVQEYLSLSRPRR